MKKILAQIVTVISIAAGAQFAHSAASRNSVAADVPNTPGGAGTTAKGSVASPNDILNHAIDDASRRLQRQSCSSFFGPGAVERLTSAKYRLVDLGAPRFEANEPVVTAARTIRESNTIVINVAGPFITPRLALAGRYYYFNAILSRSDDPINLSDSEFRVLILLHELGHLTGKFGADRKDVKQSQAANSNVLRNCF